MILSNLLEKYAVQDPAIIDSLTRDHGILTAAEWIAASHNVTHQSKKSTGLKSGSFIALDGSITPQKTDNTIVVTTLKVAASLQEESNKIVDNYPAGKKAYMENNSAEFYEGLGNTIVDMIIYGNSDITGSPTGANAYDGLRKISDTNSMSQELGGATAKSTSIFAVRFHPKNAGILFSPEAFAKGQLIKVEPLADGKPTTVVTDTSTGAQKVVYQNEYSSLSAFIAADTKYIAAITQIDDTHAPTINHMETMLDSIKSDKNSFIFVSRRGRRFLKALKLTYITMTEMSNGIRVSVMDYNGTPVLIEESISDVEAWT